MNPLRSPIFWERFHFLRASQFWPRPQLEEFQLAQIQRIVEYAGNNVPFYTEYMSANRISANDIRAIGDLKIFPVVRKQDIQSNPRAFLSKLFPVDTLENRTTGGSTGEPLTIYSDFDHYARDKANTNYYMSLFGLDIFKFRSIRLYGDRIPPEVLEKGGLGHVVDNRRFVMSAYEIRKGTLDAYIDTIDDFDPDYFHTRPSSILPLARLMIENNRLLKKPVRFLFCDGEYITDGQRRTIEQAFRGRLINVYGHTEGCVFGHPCELTDTLHFPLQIGHLELQMSNGASAAERAQRGEMVVTGFNNLAMPLIRYGTGDMAVLGASECKCGRHAVLLDGIDGRMQDYVVSFDNELIPLAPAIFNYNDMDWRGVREFQVTQAQPGELTLKVVPENEEWKERLERETQIGRKVGEILGPGFRVTVGYVDAIPKSRIGKHRYLDQKLSIERSKIK